MGDTYTVQNNSMQCISLSADISLARVQATPLHVQDLGVVVPDAISIHADTRSVATYVVPRVGRFAIALGILEASK